MSQYKNLSLFIILTIFVSCQKDDTIPEGKGNKNEVSVTDPLLSGPTKASAALVVISSDGDAITEKGICWSLSTNPTLESSGTWSNIPATGSSTVNMLDLIPGQRYYYRTYAKTIKSTIYGAEKSFVFPADNSTLRNGLVAYYPLNGNGLDYSGSGNNLQGNASLFSGRTGLRNSAYYFNGLSDYLSVVNPKNLSSGNSGYTISFWFNAPKWVINSMLVGYGKSGANSQANYVKLTNSVVNNKTYQSLMHYHWNNDWVMWYYTSDYTNNWERVTITHDGTSTRYYSFGSLVSSRSVRVDVVPNILSIAARIETPPTSNIKEYFNGIIDDVRIYNRALTPAEVTSLANY
jgi:hypothetical protein